VIPILKRIEVGDYPSKIARIYGWSKQHVFYYLRKLEKAELVRRKVRSNVVFYELTRKGQKLLTSCEGVVYGSGVFRLHRCFVKFPVLREGVYPLGDFRRVEMVNWTALLGLERGVKVRHTTRHWIVHVEALYGRHPGELFVLAKNLADRVAKGLMLKYGCVLGEGRVGRGYELAVDDPVAKLLSRYFTVSTSRRKMDHSPGELEGEIDHLSRDAAIEYLLMPERVKKLEGQVTALASMVEDLRGDVRELVSVLKGALDTGSKVGVPEYVQKRDPLGVC
jgi:predicted transcriptional regulator